MGEINRGLNAATKRFASLTRSDFDSFVQKLKGVTQNLETLSSSIPDGHGIRVDGATKGQRAMELLESYVVLVNEAVTN